MSYQSVCGIDIGNSTIKTVIADRNQETGNPRIVGIGIASSNGLRRGVVVDMEEVIASIKQSVTQAETMAGQKITQAYVGINGTHIKTQLSKGVVAVSRADNEISQSDIDRVIEAASTVSLPQNYEIIHVIPKNFTIDGQEVVKNPLGMKGIRLEVEVILIEGLTPYIHNLTKCINANNIDVAELVFAPLAAAKSVLDKHQREYGVLLLDFGGGVTSMALFHEGDLLHTSVLPIGSKHVTNDIAIAMRTSIENAQRIKHEHGFTGTTGSINKKEMIDISDIVGDNVAISRKQIGKIIDARMNEMFDVIMTELKKTPGIQVLPAGMVLAGSGANLTGLLEVAKQRLGLATRFGRMYSLDGLSDTVTDPGFAVPIGLVMWGLDDQVTHGSSSSSAGNFFKKIGSWLKNFMP